jgi:hypothetical protein
MGSATLCNASASVGLVCWLPGSGQNLAVVLFGELLFGADTESDGFEPPVHAWRHDPRSGAQSVETT